MASTSSWLQKQRKGDLQELADILDLKISDGSRKSEIEMALEECLKSQPELSSDSRFAPFYKRRPDSATSPIKKEASSTNGDRVIRSTKRRVTRAAEELTNAVSGATTEDSEVEVAPTTRARALTRTPRASALSLAQSMPLPPSPSVVVDAIDRNAAVLRRKVSRAFEGSGVIETTHSARDSLSSVVSVEAIIIFFEAYCLRQEILEDRYAFTIPAISLLGFSEYPVHLPDLFLLLTVSFWGPALLWIITSLFLPLIAAYFFNLTSKPRPGRGHNAHFNYTFDPLTFNIVKALLTHVVYFQGVTFSGLADPIYIEKINYALYGGPSSVLVGCAIGILVTFYEAIIKK